jgi:anti-sigma regulatory factor (Ser/Thr protein kinase)
VTGAASHDAEASPSCETPALGLSLGRDQHAPSLARAALRTFTEDAAIAVPVSATLALLVSELVTNAVLHSDAPAASGIQLRTCRLDGRAVRVEVIDAGNGFAAAPRQRDPCTTGGYGLFLVDRQASRWGVDRDDGTRVWFELDNCCAGDVGERIGAEHGAPDCSPPERARAPGRLETEDQG